MCLLFGIFRSHVFSIFFFNDTATTEIYTLSLHDALPIWRGRRRGTVGIGARSIVVLVVATSPSRIIQRSEEHTSELQSPCNLVCRLLLEKKKINLSTRSSRLSTSPIHNVIVENHNRVHTL